MFLQRGGHPDDPSRSQPHVYRNRSVKEHARVAPPWFCFLRTGCTGSMPRKCLFGNNMSGTFGSLVV